MGSTISAVFERWITTRRLTAVAWVTACVATAGSLHYSLGMGLFPCKLCWYQRILMYPLSVVLGVALLWPGQDHEVPQFVLPLSVPGLGIAAYHSWLQVQPSLTCSAMACGIVRHRVLGLSIPNQALVAFSVVTACSVAVAVQQYRRRTV